MIRQPSKSHLGLKGPLDRRELGRRWQMQLRGQSLKDPNATSGSTCERATKLVNVWPSHTALGFMRRGSGSKAKPSTGPHGADSAELPSRTYQGLASGPRGLPAHA